MKKVKKELSLLLVLCMVLSCIPGAVFAEGEYAGVRMHGFVTAAYTGTAPAVGRAILVANGTGGVKTADSGEKYIVVDKDTAAKTVTFLM